MVLPSLFVSEEARASCELEWRSSSLSSPLSCIQSININDLVRFLHFGYLVPGLGDSVVSQSINQPILPNSTQTQLAALLGAVNLVSSRMPLPRVPSAILYLPWGLRGESADQSVSHPTKLDTHTAGSFAGCRRQCCSSSVHVCLCLM